MKAPCINRSYSTFPYTVPDTLYQCLTGLEHFIYYPNPGNLGDELIAASTVTLFDRIGLSYEVYEEGKDYGEAYTLVYGGGGGLVSEWGWHEVMAPVFSSPGLSRCVILPHSIRGCRSILRLMDERFTVFCREHRSLEYCRKFNQKAFFLPADDMAFYFSLLLLPSWESLVERCAEPGILLRLFSGMNLIKEREAHLCRFYRKTCRRLLRHLSSRVQFLEDGRRVGWFLREDQERDEAFASCLPPVPRMDVSRYGGGDCRWHDYNMMGVYMLLHAVNAVDVVVTDRLHVSIAAAMAARETMMIDNSYGKLSGVHEQSMKSLSHVSFCRNMEELLLQLRRSNVPVPNHERRD